MAKKKLKNVAEIAEAVELSPRAWSELILTGDYCIVGTKMTDFIEADRKTVLCAIDRGEIPVRHLACGTRIVSVASLKQWEKDSPKRKRGPKPSPKE